MSSDTGSSLSRTAEDVVRDYHCIKQEHGKITQTLVAQHATYSYKQAMKHFDAFKYIKLEVNILESDYVDAEIRARDDYEPILLRLMRACYDDHGKVTRRLIGEEDNMPKISDYRRTFETLTRAKEKAGLGENAIMQFTDSQLEEREDEMLDVFRECKDKHGKVTKELFLSMDSPYGLKHLNRHFGSFGIAKQEALDNPNMGGITTGRASAQDILDAIEECAEEYGEVTRDTFIENYYSRAMVERHFGTLSEAKKAADVEDVGRINTTEEERERLDRRVREDDELREVLKGLLMSDGNIDGSRNEGEACFSISLSNKRFLEWLDDYLGDLSLGLKHSRTPEKGAKRARKAGFRPNAKAENYSHMYRIRTRRLPVFTEMYDRWYDGEDGKKRYPDDLELTPMAAKMWYCGDGGLAIGKDRPRYAEITCKNEANRTEYLESLFDRSDADVVSVTQDGTINIGRHTTRFLNWIGDAPSGFEYKWETGSRERYKQLKKEAEEYGNRDTG